MRVRRKDRRAASTSDSSAFLSFYLHLNHEQEDDDVMRIAESRNRLGYVTWGCALSILLNTTDAMAAKKSETPPIPVDLYVMSQCPWGVRAEDVILPAVKALAPHVQLRLRFIGDATPDAGGDPAKTQFSSMHGPGEVQEDMRQLCAEKHFPKPYLDYILERNKNISDPNWQDVAKRTGLDPKVIDQCTGGAEGATLMAENLKAHNARGANSSPTIDIDGTAFTGTRGPRTITLALCQAMQAKGITPPKACAEAEALPPDPVPTASGCGAAKPAAPAGQAGGCGGGGGCGANGGCGGCANCGAVAKPSPAQAPGGIDLRGVPSSPLSFDIRVLQDPSCTVCQLRFLDTLRRLFPSAHVFLIDVASEQGKQLMNTYHPHALPFYLLANEVQRAETFGQLRGLLEQVQGGYVVRSDAAMPQVWLDRPRVAHHLDLFVSPLAPSTPGPEAVLMRFFEQTTIKDLTFSLHFLVQELPGQAAELRGRNGEAIRSASLKELGLVSPGPIDSAGGSAEVQESLRQVCLFQHASMGDFFAYLTCRNQNLQDPKWGSRCFSPSKALGRCLEGEGERLLREDAHLVKSFGLAEGPVLMWENRMGPFGVEQLDMLQALPGDKSGAR